MVHEIILTVFECVALVVCFLIGKFIVPALKKTVSSDTMTELKEFIETYVRGVEQKTTAQNAGEEKLAEVTKLVTNKANELGLNISDTDINMMIEAAVLGLNEGTKTTTTVKVEQ